MATGSEFLVPVRLATEVVQTVPQDNTKQVPRPRLLLVLLVRHKLLPLVVQQPVRLGPSAMQALTIQLTRDTKTVPVGFVVLVPLRHLPIDLLAVKPVPVEHLQPHRAQQSAKRGP